MAITTSAREKVEKGENPSLRSRVRVTREGAHAAHWPLPLVLKLPRSAVPFALAFALTPHLSWSLGDGAMDVPSLDTSCKQRPGSPSSRTAVLRRAAEPQSSVRPFRTSLLHPQLSQ